MLPSAMGSLKDHVVPAAQMSRAHLPRGDEHCISACSQSPGAEPSAAADLLGGRGQPPAFHPPLSTLHKEGARPPQHETHDRGPTPTPRRPLKAWLTMSTRICGAMLRLWEKCCHLYQGSFGFRCFLMWGSCCLLSLGVDGCCFWVWSTLLKTYSLLVQASLSRPSAKTTGCSKELMVETIGKRNQPLKD